MNSHASRLAEYLRARRAQLKPEDVGYPRDPHRRVPGLRREEVADLAGISLEYYTRLEQGRGYNVSEQVLAALAQALKLDAYAVTYFYRLAVPAPAPLIPRTPSSVSDLLVQLVEQWSAIPVYVFDRNQDVLIANDLAKELFPSLRVAGSNSVISAFAVPAEARGMATWAHIARSAVAALRFHGDPADPRLQEIVGGLSVRDADFRTMWADHEAQPYGSGTAPIRIDGFGMGEFPFQILNVSDDCFMIVWVAPPGTFAANAIDFLRAKLAAEQATAADHEAPLLYLDRTLHDPVSDNANVNSKTVVEIGEAS